ncbi:MAG: ExeM/NucH family extracellular endonuclease [Acidobacteria bacterium]|nr:ExeM/NucH family extracellular endonuclease [Acidobacteriota bacterium]
MNHKAEQKKSNLTLHMTGLMPGSKRLRCALFCALVLAVCTGVASAQCVSLTTLGSASTQNFDTLSNTAGSTTNNLTIPGWFMTETGGGARDNEQYAVDTGSSTTGDTYSYGAAAATDRALGGLRSGTLIPNFGACFTNNTGATIASLNVAYIGEQWRLGTAARTDALNFEYSLNATDLVTGTWTNVAALNFITPFTTTVGATNGNAAANRTALSSLISSLSIPNGATFWIRWTDVDATGADDGLAVDDFSLTPNAAVVQPNLTINDVSLNEGNAGTTSFTFTVSLSTPAGAGGVTFDIATADNTATQPSDYTQKTLTSQTIPAGSSTYSFTVLVNGDTTPETNETFFVNVTNATGATVTDGQGQGTIVNDDAAPNLTINDVSLNEGNAGTTSFTFTVSLSAPAPAGGVTFDIATADGTALAPGDYTALLPTGQMIPAGSSTFTFTVLVNGDTTSELDETFFVNVTNITNAIGTDTQGQGTIVNDDITKIHDVQGNGSATPIPGATVSVEGVVVATFQGASQLKGFFLQEEDADADADPATSEGIFIFCNTCPTAVAEGQRVKATGAVSEFNNMTEITASTAGSVVVTEAANHLAEVTPAPVSLPIAGDVNAFYEAREGMLVTFVDTLTVSEYNDLFQFGQIELYQGGRPRQFTEMSPPSVAGYTAHLDGLARRKVILDDDNNVQNAPLSLPNGSQFVFHPRANGGFSVGTQGVDFFRGGDLVNGLTGVLHWSFAGTGSVDAWRIRPTTAHPVTFTVTNPRPATPPAVGGAIKAVGMNMLNYFTTIDTTSSNSTGPCGPSGTLDCRGADSVAELNRQRERASIVICTLNADVYALMEMENTTPSATITDLLGAVNTRCGGAHPYAFVNTGGTLGTDAIRSNLIYRTGIVSPVGAPLVDLDPIHNRPPTAQPFDVVDAANPAFGERFTVVANHFKSKGGTGTGGDADAGDGAGAFNATRTAQATRLLTWISSTVVPAAGDPDVLLLGDFNSYAQEQPVTTLTSGGFTDLETALLGANAYSYLFDGQLGHLDYAFASSSLFAKITGVGAWHINADESDLFDYNDEVRDSPGESTFEEKPDGSALVPPRVVFQPATPYRASDHDPVLVGLFQVADLAITKTDGVTTATPGGSVTYTITASNAGPDPVTGATVADTFPAALTCTWTCVGAGGGTCTASGSGNINNSVNLPSGGSVTYTASCSIAANATGTLSNTATVAAPGGVSDPTPGNNSATDSDTLAPQADLAITKTDGVTTATPGGSVTYTITASNAGPSNAPGATVADTFPAALTCTWTCVGAGGGTCTASGSGNINNSVNLPSGGSVTYTASCSIAANATGTLSNTATVAAPGGVTDPTPGNNSATDSDTLSASANLGITKTDGVTTVTPGGSATYTITASNAGPSNATGATVADTFPASLTCTWTCVGAGGGTCTASGSGNINNMVNLPTGASVTYTASCTISAAATGTLSNTATVTAPGGVTDPTPGNNSATDTDTILLACPSTLTVNDLGDTPDNNPGDRVCNDGTGKCTLRAALMEANAITACSPLTIDFSVTGTINLATALPNLNHPNLTISGPGADQLDVHRNAAALFRIFSINSGKTVALSGLSISNGNVTGVDGGGVFSSGNLTLTNCALTGNQTDGEGGAVYATLNGQLTLTGCTLNGNTANKGGGVSSGTVPPTITITINLTNTTISGNVATATGGGIGLDDPNVTMNLLNVTIANNTASASGGGINQTAGTLNFKNTLVAGNTAPAGTDIAGVANSQDYNLIGNTSGATLTGTTTHNLTGVAALLGSLANNGGPTPTQVPLPGSPAIDKGNAGVTTDQRGQARPFDIPGVANAAGGNAADIGAVEVQCAAIALAGLPGGAAGVAYTSGNMASGGTAPYTLSVTAGALPPGVTINGNGLTGTPTQLGTFSFTLLATDAYGCQNSQSYTVVIVCPATSLNPASLPNATINTAYAQTITASPAGSYTFAVTSGVLPTGLTLNANGSFSGAPTQGGTFNFRVTATGFGGCTGFRDYTLVVLCPAITLSPSSLPGGTVGTGYSQTVSAAPAGSYSYAVSSGALPAGVTLNAATGALTGTPTTTGSFSFTITASAGGCSGAQSYTVVIGCAGIAFTTSSPLPAGLAGVAYAQTLSVSPAGSYTFTLVTGNLPAGLPLNAVTGVISGLPTVTGTYTFTVKAQTAGGCSATQAYTLAINCPPVTLSPASLPNGTVGTAYSQTLAASPAGGNYTFALTSGALPGGLNLNPATGSLSGTPTTNGSFTFTITATGFGACAGSRSYTVVVGSGGCPTITLPGSLPNGAVGQLYNNTVAASPSGSYSYTAAGTLPPGVTFYNAAALLFGYPTTPGTYNFTITATQGACTGSQSYSVLITANMAAFAQVADYDGDGQSDAALWSASTGRWNILRSSTQQSFTSNWGMAGDLALLGDYDGDGQSDLAVFRPSSGTWFVKRSSDGGFLIKAFGVASDVPVPGDYDGDGKTDLAVFRPSEGNWYIWRSSDERFEVTTWGAGAAPYLDVPVPGDYDGDGKTDLAVFRRANGTWLVKRSSDGQFIIKQWGLSSDVPVAADYDGDGKTDLAVWRGATGAWYIWQSKSNRYRIAEWGAGYAPYLDQAAPADYDGDGQADLAVWRASEQTWYIQASKDGAVKASRATPCPASPAKQAPHRRDALATRPACQPSSAPSSVLIKSCNSVKTSNQPQRHRGTEAQSIF